MPHSHHVSVIRVVSCGSKLYVTMRNLCSSLSILDPRVPSRRWKLITTFLSKREPSVHLRLRALFVTVVDDDHIFDWSCLFWHGTAPDGQLTTLIEPERFHRAWYITLISFLLFRCYLTEAQTSIFLDCFVFMLNPRSFCLFNKQWLE
jgi:hypothetical protein